MRFKFDREFYVPKNHEGVVRHDEVGVIAYLWHTGAPSGSKPGATIFSGKGAKPVSNFYYVNDAARDAAIARVVEGAKAHVKYKAERKAERSKPHSLKVGDILYAAWGYDQTNIDFYQVVKVPSGKSVVIQEIKASSEGEDGFMTALCSAVPNAFKGEPMLKRASAGNHISLNSYSGASPWDGKPLRYSWYA